MNKKKRIRGIMLFSLLTILSVFVLYCIFGTPPLTPKMAMRQMEAKELIGPSRIIAEGELWYGAYDRFILGETEYGYCLYEYYEDPVLWNDVLTYAEKTEIVTAFSLGMTLGYYGNVPGESGLILPVFAIPDSGWAVSGKLTVTAQYEGNQYEASDSAVLEQGVFFLFEPAMDDIHPHVRDFWTRCFSGQPPVYNPISGTVTMELFNSRGEVIETVIIEFPATM